MISWDQEVKAKQRFEFGKNWKAFLTSLKESQIIAAEQSLIEMLGSSSLEGKRFLDVGCGSGIFSLAARRLGAEVYSFDYDTQSVACTCDLRKRFFMGDTKWKIEEGSALDLGYLKSLPEADIIYSWGVLHHTGDMWTALRNIGQLVPKGGRLFIAIYNDQGGLSRFWLKVKKIYNSGAIGKTIVVSSIVPIYILKGLGLDLIRLRSPLRRYSEYKRERGMSIYYDWIDWLGGYPFEFSTAETVIDFFQKDKLLLYKLKQQPKMNEFVFLNVGDLEKAL